MRAAGAEDLRREVVRGRRERQARGDCTCIPGERALERSRALLAVVRIVVEERDPEALRNQVFREPEGDAVVGRRDPEDVPPLRRVDQALPALVCDRDRDVRVTRDLP